MSAVRTEASAARRARIARLGGLYAVTPDIGDTALLTRKVAAAIAGGAAAVQYRNKLADSVLRRDQARAIARLPVRARTVFIVNDDAALAAAVDADGVHIGADDADVATARALVGTDRIVGVSCYGDIERANAAVEAGADYVAFGAFFPSETKASEHRPELELLEWWQQMMELPCVAIGGITPANCTPLVEAGADFLAVSNAVWGGDEAEAVRAFAKLLK